MEEYETSPLCVLPSKTFLLLFALLPLSLSPIPPMHPLLPLDVHPPSGRQLPGSCAADEGGS